MQTDSSAEIPIPPRKPEKAKAQDELREVAECVRALLGVSPEPASLGRLYRMHKEIQAHIQEIENDNNPSDFCI